jgi:hypothetical protein
MRTIDHYARALDLMQGAKSRYLDDLDAMTHEQLASPFAGNARSGYDFTYEVALVNRKLAERIAGQEPEWPQSEGWVTAPAEFCTKDACRSELAESCDAVIAALQARGPEGALAELTTKRGPSSPYETAAFAAMHTMCHAAQLNYIQTLHGDTEMHWKQ